MSPRTAITRNGGPYTVGDFLSAETLARDDKVSRLVNSMKSRVEDALREVAKPRPNLHLLEDTYEFIARDGLHWQQSAWVSITDSGPCGTAYCFGGWVAVRALGYTTHGHAWYAPNDPWNPIDDFNQAVLPEVVKALGLDGVWDFYDTDIIEVGETAIFSAHNTLGGIRRHIDAITERAKRREEAVEFLRDLGECVG